MTYCKITTEGQAMVMPNPYRMTIANPNDAKKALIAQLDNWLEMMYTELPAYDPETQYVTDCWVEENGRAVQHWVVHSIESEA